MMLCPITSLSECSCIVYVLVQLILTLCSRLGVSAVSCFECYSVDASEPDCEDEFAPYNRTGRLFRRDCTVGTLDFEAFYCIKIKGVKDDGHAVMIRTCSTTDWGSQCGDIFFEQGDVIERLYGCLASCDYDGCNDANRLLGYGCYGSLVAVTLLLPIAVIMFRD